MKQGFEFLLFFISVVGVHLYFVKLQEKEVSTNLNGHFLCPESPCVGF
jgi:hypothetical protein